MVLQDSDKNLRRNIANNHNMKKAQKRWGVAVRYGSALALLFMTLILLVSHASADEYRIEDSANSAGMEPDIVGGQEADIGEYPWQAVLQTSDSEGYTYLCGGSLIDPHWVLTAAHCVYDDQSKTLLTIDIVILGAHNITVKNESGRQKFGAKQVIMHHNYNPNTVNNDIALIELDSRAEMTEYVSVLSPASSPQNDNLMQAGVEATVSGWGQTGVGSSASPVLMEVTVPVVRQSTCQLAYAPIGGIITSNMLCAGYSEGGKDTCRGDSGGPLIAPDGNGAWKQIGIVSWGYYPCAEPGYYGVYTRVANYYDWIMENLGVTGTPSPTATPANTHEPTATATATKTPFATKTATPTKTPIPTATPGPTPTPFDNLVINSDFEANSPIPWESSSTQGVALISDNVGASPADGDFVAQLGVVDNEESRLWQTLALPSVDALYLSFDYAIDSEELGCFQDVGKVYAGEDRIMQVVLCNDTNTFQWEHQVLDITHYAGKSLNLQFFAQTNNSDPSAFYIDNVQVASFLEAGEIAIPAIGVNDNGSGDPGAENIANESIIYLPLVTR